MDIATRTLAALALAAPLAATAQVSYSQARIGGDEQYYRYDTYRCAERRQSLSDRLYALDLEKAQLDRDSQLIADINARIAMDSSRLDANDVAAVERHNQRVAEQTRRVEEHNRRVADMNADVARVNEFSAEVSSMCNLRDAPRYYYERRIR